jgi:hypothetical protein
MKPAKDRPPLLLRLFSTTVLTSHGLAAAWWLWAMPGGFPLAHPRFWANRVAPAALLAFVVAAIVARATKRPAVVAVLMVALPAAWLGVSIGLLATFHVSGPMPAAATAVAGLALTAGWALALRKDARLRLALPVAIVAALVGGSLPETQRADQPSTRPLEIAVPLVTTDGPAIDPFRAAKSAENVMIRPHDGAITMELGRVNMTLNPLLTFIDSSPDGCWTVVNPRERHWLDAAHKVRIATRDETGFAIAYDDFIGGQTALRVQPDTDGRGTTTAIESVSRLDADVYSHLNRYCELGVYGHQSLSVSFSPCPDARIEVTYSEYPVGRPQRCAYLDAGGTFHVVEASSGEKGPFKPLASGSLARGEPLAITLYDAGAPLCRITLEDWSAQVSTAPSPTAGWGLPVNAIEFSRYGEAPSSPAAITTTLAGTSVGRGWDSVGHAAGTYRNRVRVERMHDGETKAASQ